MQQDGDYYNDAKRSPQEIKELRSENRHQNERLARVEREVRDMRIALVGIDDRNGLRGELRQYQKSTDETLNSINSKLDSIPKTIMYTILGVIGAAGTLGGLIYGAIRALGG